MSPENIQCPKCHSSQITANKKGFSVGNAAKGVAAGLVGVPGGVLWGLKGKDKIIITCLNCGHQFKPGEGKSIQSTVVNSNYPNAVTYKPNYVELLEAGDKESIKLQLQYATEALKDANKNLQQIMSFQIGRSKTSKEEQIKQQENIIKAIKVEISEWILKLNETPK
jgi:hypothetical protein